MVYSVVFLVNPFLPGRFLDSHDFPLACQFAEANAANLEFSHESANSAAKRTAIVDPGPMYRFFPGGKGLEKVAFSSGRFDF